MDDPDHKQGAQEQGAAEERITTPRVGWLAGWRAGQGGGEAGQALVDFAGNTRGPLPARATVAMDPEADALAGRQVLLLFEEGDPARPLVVGLLQEPSDTPNLDLILESADLPEEEEDAALPEARVDGRRVVLEGKDEVVLRCGKATITLRRNGRIVIRGTYLVSRSGGVNRIKGGSVQIN